MRTLVHSVRQGTRLIGAAVGRQVREAWFGRWISARPTMLQFVVGRHGDRGQGRQRSDARELSPDEVRRVLADRLFREIQHLVIANTEPGLRSELPTMAEVLLGSLSKLRSLRVTADGVPTREGIERVQATASVSRAHDVDFSVLVRWDGIIDPVGRRHAAMGRAAEVDGLVTLRENDVAVTVVCALSAVNCYEADDLLVWCAGNDIKVRFRLAADAELRTPGPPEDRSLSPEQRFHVLMFFDQLARRPDIGPGERSYYKSQVDRLTSGRTRRARCGWRSRGIALDNRGELSSCPSRELCESCPEEGFGPPSVREVLGRGWDVIRNVRRQRSCKPRLGTSLTPSVLAADREAPGQWRHVLITGWYGTETTGDKAILGGLLDFLRAHAPGCRLTVTTMDEKVSRQTERELPELQGAAWVAMERGHLPALIESVDAVIIGGGPLMEIPGMELIRRMFVEANRQRKARVVFGCGVGPLHSEVMRQVTGAILRLATAGFLRDRESHDLAARLAPDNVLRIACDPALAYLKGWLSRQRGASSPATGPRRIAGLLRGNTREFVVGLGKSELGEANARAAQWVARILAGACEGSDREVALLAMNAPWIGGDDRLFNRMVAERSESAKAVRAERSYMPLAAVIEAVHAADAAVAMRYHGHLFCLALGIPFLSIDYTGRNGKVQSLVERIGYDQFSVEWGSIDVEGAVGRLKRLMDERQYWSEHLRRESDRLVADLHQTYRDVFDVGGENQ